MKTRILFVFVFVIFSSKILAQPPETIYLGNVAFNGHTDDELLGPFNIGFNFTYFGNTYSQFYINSNGQVLFGAGSLASAAVPIPTAAAPNNFIAPFWDDLVVDSYGSILYTTIGASPNRKLIVQFKNMGFYPFPATLGTFSVILYETSNIVQIQYRLIVLTYSGKAHGGTASIGLENSDGTSGVQYSFHNPAAINTGQAISFSPIAGPSYSVNSNAVYDGVFLTPNLTLPDPGITTLVSPPQDAVIGSGFTFSWANTPNAASYTLYVGTDPELVGASTYPAGANLAYDITGLTLNTTYYWAVFSKNATGTTWCEIKRFTTSSAPPLAPVPLTIWAEQPLDKTIKLQFSGGNGSAKTAIITSLPAQGQLYQYNSGARGALISSVPVTITDAGMNLIYAAAGNAGNGAGNFNFKIHDSSGDSPEATVTVNVSPPGIPNILYIAKGTNIEIQADIPMADPAGKQNQFSVKVNGLSAAISSISLKPGDPNSIILSLATPLTGSETVLVSYTAGNITSAQGGFLVSFTDQTITLRLQTITFTSSLLKKYGDPPFTISATSTSGLALTFSSSNLPVATILNSTVTINSAGSSDITARQAGNATWAPANYSNPLTVAKADQTILFNALPLKTFGDIDFALSAAASSGLNVSYSSNNPLVATVSGNLVHIVSGGTALITASQSGNSNYNAAPDVSQTLTVRSTIQTISFSSLPLKIYGDADFTISASASSGLIVSFSSDNPAVATVSGNLIHITGAGTAQITATQSGDNNYIPATPVSQSLTVSKATLTFTAENKSKDYLAVNPVLTFQVQGFVNGETISVLDNLPSLQTTCVPNSPVGTYPITITGGSDNNYGYIYVSGVLTVNKIAQSISFTDVPVKLLVKDSYPLEAISTSGLPVLFESSDNTIASLTGNLLTGVSKGNVQIRAYNSGDQNYTAAEIFVSVEIYSTHKDILYLFTPNNDGFNDYWELPDLPSWGKCDVKVYNRWGKLVFSDPDYNNLWDGTSSGNPLPEGAYIFIIKTQNAGTVKGTVNIVR